MTSKNFRPEWTEKSPAPGTYRSIFKYGDPQHFKHPSDAWYRMIKQDFRLKDEDFASRAKEGLEQVTLNRPTAFKPQQIEAIQAIVGKENVSLDDYDRVKYASGKTT